VPRCRAVRVRRVCSTTSRLQHPCGEEAEDEPAEEYAVDDEGQEGVFADVAHEEGDDADGDDEGDEGGAGGFEGAEYFGRAGAVAGSAPHFVHLVEAAADDGG